MANNIPVIVAGGGTENLKTTDNGGVHTTHHNVDSVPGLFGSTADPAKTSDADGTMIGFLRGLVKWCYERMPASLGIKTASASLPVQLSSDNPLPTKVSTDNSTSTPLGAANSFSGTGEDVSKFRSIVVSAKASHASAANGLKLQFSSDNTNWDIEQAFTLNAADGEHYIVSVLAQYFRVVYTNGGTLQTYFRLQTILHPTLAGLPTVVADGQAALPVAISAGTNNIGDVDVLSQPARARTTDHIGAAAMTDAVMNGTDALTPKYATISESSSGDNEVVAGVTSKKIRVLSYVVMASAAVNVKWRSNATDKSGLLYCAANGGAVAPFSPVGHLETAAGEPLNLNLSGAVAVGGHVTYIEV